MLLRGAWDLIWALEVWLPWFTRIFTPKAYYEFRILDFHFNLPPNAIFTATDHTLFYLKVFLSISKFFISFLFYARQRCRLLSNFTFRVFFFVFWLLYSFHWVCTNVSSFYDSCWNILIGWRNKELFEVFQFQDLIVLLQGSMAERACVKRLQKEYRTLCKVYIVTERTFEYPYQ